jgi:hypothetical protein
MPAAGPPPAGPPPGSPAWGTTAPIGRVATAESPFGFGAPHDDPHDSPGGVHRPDTDRRWLWLVGLVAVALLAVSGLVALLVAAPRNSQPRPAVTLGSRSVAAPRSPGVTTPTAAPASTPDQTGLANTLRPTVPPPHTATPPLVTPTVVPPPTRPGPQLVPVPRVIGQLAATAIATLRAKGFGTNIVAAPIGRPGQANRVLLQSPEAGQTAPLGSTVTIIIAAGIQPR